MSLTIAVAVSLSQLILASLLSVSVKALGNLHMVKGFPRQLPISSHHSASRCPLSEYGIKQSNQIIPAAGVIYHSDGHFKGFLNP